MPIAIPWKFAAKINVREKRFELDFPAMKKDFELTSVKYVLEDQNKTFSQKSKSALLYYNKKICLNDGVIMCQTQIFINQLASLLIFMCY